MKIVAALLFTAALTTGAFLIAAPAPADAAAFEDAATRKGWTLAHVHS